MFFRNNYSTMDQSLFLWDAISLSLLVTAAVCCFSVDKFIGWDPENIYLFKFNSKNTKKWSDVCPKLPINTIESRSSVFIVNFENYSHFFSVFL